MSEFSYPEEPTESTLFSMFESEFERAPYEQLARTLEDRVMLLETLASPDVYMQEAIDMPFGRDGRSFLSGALTMQADGRLNGMFSVKTPKGVRNFMPRIFRDPNTHTWSYEEFNNILKDADLLRKLDHNWPTHLYDNSFVREVSREAIDTLYEEDRSEEINHLFCEYLLPQARQTFSIKIYNSYEGVAEKVTTGKLGAPDHTTLKIERRNLENSDQPLLVIKLERSIETEINGVNVTVACIAECDESGEVLVDIHYINPDTRKLVNLPVKDQKAIVEEFTRSLDILVTEKLNKSADS